MFCNFEPNFIEKFFWESSFPFLAGKFSLKNGKLAYFGYVAAILKRNHRFTKFLLYLNCIEMVHICDKFHEKQLKGT